MKNKEIEELLNDIKFEYNNKEKWITDMALSEDAWGLLLSYIEQLEEELKKEQEENYKQSEWLVKKQKKIEQLENNRDKAIEINKYIYDNLENMDFGEVKCKINRVSDILKGDSDV